MIYLARISVSKNWEIQTLSRMVLIHTPGKEIRIGVCASIL